MRARSIRMSPTGSANRPARPSHFSPCSRTTRSRSPCTVSAFAMANATGVDAIVAASQAQGPGLLFALSEQHLGTVFANTAYVLFLTSQFACLLSFHNAIARYFFALGREELLPERLS